QYIKLPPGSYRLAFKVSAFNAVMPKSLLWSLMCVEPSGAILQAEIPEGDYRDRIINIDFSVSRECPLQMLTLQTRALVESWRNRYKGRVLFHNIRISEVHP